MARKASKAAAMPVVRSVNDLISLRGMAEMASATQQQVLDLVKSGEARGTLSPHDGAYWFTPVQRKSVLEALQTP